MRASVYAAILSILPIIISAWGTFDDASCSARVQECVAKWQPQPEVQEEVVGDKGEDMEELQEAFCGCWEGLHAGDCKDDTQKNKEGVQHSLTCGSRAVSSQTALVVFSLVLAIFFGVQRDNT